MIAPEMLKFTMVADDVLLFLSGSNDLFSPIFANLQEFCNHCNCKIKSSKCQCFLIINNRNCVNKPIINKNLK